MNTITHKESILNKPSKEVILLNLNTNILKVLAGVVMKVHIGPYVIHKNACDKNTLITQMLECCIMLTKILAYIWKIDPL